MNRRRAIAILALLGVFDSTYLLLHKLGQVGTLVCAIEGGCDTVNTSQYASLLGFPVAGYGVIGYLLILCLALVSIQPGWVNDHRADAALALVSGLGALFSIYLTLVSLFVIEAACQWCLISLALILSIFTISIWGVAAQLRMAIEGR